MNIGFDASRVTIKERTGTENYSFYLARSLARVDEDNRYTLYFREDPGKETLEEITQGNPRFQVKVIRWPRFWTQGGLAWECLRKPLDLLFVPAHTLPIIRRPSLRSVVTIHDLGFEYLPEYHQFPQKLYLDKATKFAAHYATHLIAVSKATRADLQQRFSVPAAKISVVYEGVDRERFEVPASKETIKEIREKHGISGPYILFVGTVQPRKNLRRLIEAFSLILADPSLEAEVSSKIDLKHLSLVIVGKAGWLFEEIYRAPREFGVKDCVQFLGHVSDRELVALYQNALCVTLPSLYEGFGLPVLEAMASDAPVVTSSVSSLTEVGGDAAIYIDPYDVYSIASGIREVLRGYGTSFYEELVRRGHVQVEKFSWEQCARETLRVFEHVVGQS